ncbi:hypothetical protein CLNEO_23270 [Anaerotignum neopropionicum]|uniref:Uncharacterized protein n=1 Tax=Anaerotignum neopropionicum TaxID=36847 RepID=A0A136WD03_9FIRM|nr:hypothetical protein CLNEO_23270 [Anaerotignum neopropionicum]
MSTRANIIRDKGRPQKGSNAEEGKSLFFFSLVVRLRTVQLSLVPPMERYKLSFCNNIFYCMQNLEVGACRLFLFW